MELASLWTCLVLAGCLCLGSGQVSDGTSESSASPGEASLQPEHGALGPIDPEALKPLFLTPMIKKCEYELAKKKSKLGILEAVANVSAYSGYITVHNNANNLFFVFVEAKENPSTAPLLLWTPGGPGLPSVLSLLLQNGPVMFDATGNLTKRELTLQTSMSIIYLDAPVGAGFSFTENYTTYSKSLEEVTVDIKEFLDQFLQLFSEYKKRPFYAAGDSYGARYSVALAHDMLSHPGVVDLKFEGVIGGVGFYAPVYYSADSCDFLLQASMVKGEEACTEFKSRLGYMKALALRRDITNATYLLFGTIFTSTDPEKPTLFQQLTLYNSHASALYTERPWPMIQSFFLANQTIFKILIHAGQNASLVYPNEHLLWSLAADWFVDITNQTEYVLNKTRVLLYAGQVDTLFPAAKQQEYFESLNWTHAPDYRKAERRLWQPCKRCGAAAYIKSADHFTSAVVLGMGHYAGFDKPLETHYLITQFVNGSIVFPSSEM